MTSPMTTGSMTERLAEVASALNYREIPKEASDIAKRVIVDALACTIGGFHSPTGRILREYAIASGGPAEATLIGTGHAVSSSSAIVANQAMLRYLDYNDDLDVELGPGNLAGCHPSGSLPVAFAAAEASGATGQQLIEAVIAGYEVMGRLIMRFKTSLEVRHFHHGSVHPYAGAAMAGRLMGLSKDQIMHAMGIAGSLFVGLDILDAEGEEYVMAKNVADGMLAERGHAAAKLAKLGLTGPERVIEGKKGFAEAVLGGHDMFDVNKPAETELYILHTDFKSMCTEITTQGHLHGTVSLVRDHKIRPDDVERVVVRTNKRAVRHTGDPIKKYPRNKETADHSSYFLQAMAILQGSITPRIYAEANFKDPRVRSMIDRVTLEHGPEFDAISPAAEVTITLKGGKQVTRRVDREEVTALHKEQQSDAGLRRKFIECAGDVMTPSQIDRVIEACLSLERQNRVQDLLGLLRLGKP